MGWTHSPWDPSTSRLVGGLVVDAPVVLVVVRVQRRGGGQLAWGDDVATLQAHGDETHCMHTKQREREDLRRRMHRK